MGAFASNIIQLIVAKYLIFGKAAIIMAPPVILLGTITSIIVGTFAGLFILKSQWLKTVITEKEPLC